MRNNNQDYGYDLLRGLNVWENVVVWRRDIPQHLRQIFEEKNDGVPVWKGFLRFICRHFLTIVKDSFSDNDIKCYGWVVIANHNGGDIQAVGPEPEADELPEELSIVLMERFDHIKRLSRMLPTESLFSGKDFPIIVKIHPLSDEKPPDLLYVLAPEENHPICLMKPSSVGRAIWASAQHVIFNRTTSYSLQIWQKEYEKNILDNNILSASEIISKLWPMYYLTHEDLEFDGEELNLKKSIKKLNNDFRSKLVSFALKVALGPYWAHQKGYNVNGIDLRFAEDLDDFGLFDKKDHNALLLGRITAIGTDMDVILPHRPSLLTCWLNVLYNVRRIKSIWCDGGGDVLEEQWDRVLCLIIELCKKTKKYFEKALIKNIIIDHEWTRAYLALQCVRSISEETIQSLGLDFSPHGLTIAEYMATVVIVALRKYEIPVEENAGSWFDPTMYTEALINIVAWYAHRVVGVEVDLPVADTLRRVYRAEASLYSLKSYYRDHLYHVIDVCMLGDLILSDDLSLSSQFGENNEKEENRKQWYVASLFHDVGYIAELVNVSLKMLNTLESNDIAKFRDSLNIAYKKAEEKFSDRLFLKLDMMRNKCVSEGLDHGATSASYLNHFLTHVPDGFTRFRPAMDAVIAHNLHPNYPINHEKSPLSALLAFCDELQEWGRSTMDDTLFSHHVASTRVLGDYPQKAKIPLEYLEIKKDDAGCTFRLRYRPPEQGLFDTARLWLSKVSNFERITWNEIAKGWIICIEVPRSKEYHDLGIYEMDLIEICAWKHTELLPLRRWVQAANKPGCYSKNKEQSEDDNERTIEALRFRLDLGGLDFRPVQKEALNALGAYQKFRRDEINRMKDRVWAVPQFS